ncbi:MAG: phosphate signaling complex protein PhoU [Eubacteriales bacterium]|nr:phosphate signaling complex protein PhoU [Eubacteriales bacterium]MDD3350207.1 phosphate signaling complex protein PhoU [Eubacteriales bacterium]
MRNRFETQLEELNTELILMGGLIEASISSAVKALIEQDKEQAQKAILADVEIDEKEKEIESLCLKLLLQQQPVARDLRLISAALKMITDMERIGDQAADISEIAIYLSDGPHVKKLETIPEMAKATIKMVSDSIDAFVRKDLVLAEAVIDADDIVDELFLTVKNDLIALIHGNAETGGQALDLLMIAKYFERIGDHAVNIAEWVSFSITGEHKSGRVL